MTLVLAALSLCAGGFSQTLRWQLPAPAPKALDVAYHSNSEEIVRLMPNGIEVLSANTGDLLRSLSLPGELTDRRLSMYGTHVLGLTSTQVQIYETASGTMVASGPRPSGEQFEISPDGAMISFRTTGSVNVREVSDLTVNFRTISWPTNFLTDYNHYWYSPTHFGGAVEFFTPGTSAWRNGIRRVDVQAASTETVLLGPQDARFVAQCGFTITTEGVRNGLSANMGNLSVGTLNKMGRVRTRDGVATASIVDGRTLFTHNSARIHFPGQIRNFSISGDYARVYVEGEHFHGVYPFAPSGPNYAWPLWQELLPFNFTFLQLSRNGAVVGASGDHNIGIFNASDGSLVTGTSYQTGLIAGYTVGGFALSPDGQKLTVASQRVRGNEPRANISFFRFESYSIGSSVTYVDNEITSTINYFARNPVFFSDTGFMACSSRGAPGPFQRTSIVTGTTSTPTGNRFHGHDSTYYRLNVPGSASSDGQHAIVVGTAAHLFLVTTNPGSLVATIVGAYSDFFPNENKVLFSDSSGLKTRTFPQGDPITILNLDNIRAVRVVGHGDRIAVATSTSVRLYSYPSMDLITSFDPAGGISSAAFSSDGAFVYLTRTNGQVASYAIDLETPVNNGLYFRADPSAPVPGLVVAWRVSGGVVSLPGVVIDAASPEWETAAIGPVTLSGSSGIYWQNVDSNSALFSLVSRWAIDQDGTPTWALPVYSSGSPDWRLRAVSDVDGSGNADWHWQNTTTGLVVSWLLNVDAEVQTVRVVGFASAGMELLSVANIDGVPGAEYIFWNPTTREVIAWRTNLAGEILETVSMGSVPAGTRAAGLISLNGATQNLAVQRISDGEVWTLPISPDLTLGTAVPLAETGDNWRLVGTGRP